MIYIFSIVEDFQSSAEDKNTKEFKQNILDKLNNNEYYKDIFPEFFKGIFIKVENILKEMDAFKKMPLYENIKDMKQNN